MEIIDSHCHIYPHKIAAKAVESIGNFYNIKMNFEGTAENLLNVLNENNISKAGEISLLFFVKNIKNKRVYKKLCTNLNFYDIIIL